MKSSTFINQGFQNNDGKAKQCSSIYKDGQGNIYSYGTHYPLWFTTDGFKFRNVHGYSNTTAKHIRWCGDDETIDVDLPSRTFLSDLSLAKIKELLANSEREALDEAMKHREGTKVRASFWNQAQQFANSLLKLNH